MTGSVSSGAAGGDELAQTPRWEQDFTLALLRVAAVVHRYRSILGRVRYGVDANATMTVVALYMQGPMTPREIAALVNLTPPATTEMLDRLERAGYIQRQPHPRDRRKQLISPTTRAADAATREWRDLAALINPEFTRHDPATAEHILSTLVQVVRTVEQVNDQFSSDPPT